VSNTRLLHIRCAVVIDCCVTHYPTASWLKIISQSHTTCTSKIWLCGWRCGWSSRAPPLQVWSPEFKLQCNHKKNLAVIEPDLWLGFFYAIFSEAQLGEDLHLLSCLWADLILCGQTDWGFQFFACGPLHKQWQYGSLCHQREREREREMEATVCCKLISEVLTHLVLLIRNEALKGRGWHKEAGTFGNHLRAAYHTIWLQESKCPYASVSSVVKWG
jgi:hypothetical protein